MHKQISVSSEQKVIGVTNGIYQIEIDKFNLINQEGEYYEFYKIFNNFSYWINQNDTPSFNFSIIKASKLKKTIMTDVLKFAPTIMAFKWLISEKFYNLLKDFIIGEHYLYEVAIEDCEERYFFLKLKTVLKDEFIFDRNILTIYKNGIDEEVSFNDFNAYQKFIEENPLCQLKHIALNKELEKFDIIYTQSAGNYFSERLINTFYEKGLTGLVINNNRSIEFV